MSTIYLDYNATTPLHPEVIAEMKPLLERAFGNPSSTHTLGVEAKLVLEEARRKVAATVGASPPEIIFTSGGTESDNLAVVGVVNANSARGNHIIMSAIEHPAVAEVFAELEHRGFQVSRIGVDERGVINLEELRGACRKGTILVSVMLANNEIGTIQPIATIAEIAHSVGAVMHTDAAQAIGKIPVDVDELGVDLLTVAGHKLYAPKGVGALYVRRGVELGKLMHGAGHEQGLRPGTENVLLAAALGKACEVASRDLDAIQTAMRKTRDLLEAKLVEAFDGESIRVNGAGAPRLPNTCSVSLKGVDAGMLLAEIGQEVAASAGAACHAEGMDVSSTIQAIGLDDEWAMGTIRLSVGRDTSPADVAAAAAIVVPAIERLRPASEQVTGAAQDETRLTRFTKGLGCACKIRPQYLEKILRSLPASVDPRVLVDMSEFDDAGVYELENGTLIVQTVDFLTPIVDEPYMFGAIAAANSLSDAYAMGADPLFALNLVAFPSSRLASSVLDDILRGAYEKAAEAGISIIGGHSIEDPEPKFGLVVTATAEKGSLWRNQGAKVGDRLVLTKPLGTGLISTGLKQGAISRLQGREAAESMATLNRKSKETLNNYTVNACTDVTGFGLLGHLIEMASASGVGAELTTKAIPILEHALEMADAGFVPSGSRANLEYVGDRVAFGKSIAEGQRLVLADAQTSGGLLAAVPESDAEPAARELRKAGCQAAVIGRIVERRDGEIVVTVQ